MKHIIKEVSPVLETLEPEVYNSKAYCIKGPVFPLKSIDSSGLKSIRLLGSTFNIKYLSDSKIIKFS